MIRDRIVVGIHNQALSERTPDESQTHIGESQDTNEAMRDLTRAVEGTLQAAAVPSQGHHFCISMHHRGNNMKGIHY